ncbi:hypothetical protein [Kitasatospora sp. NPDC056273]|uniref:hypothetical protein n=1 Tax=Kitasatospora sp. NPDC056273 TaxID=3345769 RepID=UPI0035DF78FB
MAAGVGLTSSGIAQAAAPAAAPSSPASGVAGLDATKKLPGKTFNSSADRTVVSSKAGERAAAPTQGAPAQDAPAQNAPAAQSAANLGVDLQATAFSAHGFSLKTTLSSSETTTGNLTISWGDGTTSSYPVALTAGVANPHVDIHQYKTVGAFDITVTLTSGTVVAKNQVQVVTAGAEFTPHTPTRLLDTREGIGAAKAKVPARGTVALKIDGAAQIPNGVAAVVLNVTVTNTSGSGHISVAPSQDLAQNATTSSLNFVPGQTVPNLVVASVGPDGYVYLFNSDWAPVDLLADVTGYFTPTTASGYKSVPQTRIVDTREGIGTAQGKVPATSGFDVAVAGRNGVPSGVTAVALNLTVTNPQADGHLIAYPTGQAVPTTSNVNFTAGQTVANAVIVPVGQDGKITVRNGSWLPTDAVVDVVGYYSPASRSALVPLVSPERVLDTRETTPDRTGAPMPGRSFFALGMEGDTTSPQVEGWVLNTTVTNTAGAGFLSVDTDPNYWSAYRNGTAVVPQRPVSSTLNWTAGATVPNLAQTPGGKGGIIDFWNQSWSDADLLVDLLGFYQSN